MTGHVLTEDYKNCHYNCGQRYANAVLAGPVRSSHAGSAHLPWPWYCRLYINTLEQEVDFRENPFDGRHAATRLWCRCGWRSSCCRRQPATSLASTCCCPTLATRIHYSLQLVAHEQVSGEHHPDPGNTSHPQYGVCHTLQARHADL